ncbi:hypothetical protein [Dyella sp. A6]|uniref:hypothetical protein n=1 Tax=Dyella aluminiiresistens TaxID=3069105 RepID=UPI002E782069|nr:hypothetical protein [Dyella sp. A6]
MSIHVRSDRLTVRMAGAPQVYLSGTIDSDAVQRVRRLLQRGRIRPGSDVYLDSSTGDVASGMALGRLFRSARLSTHLGTWRGDVRYGKPGRPATCLDACAYAYLGGLYRWSPTGADRIGLHPSLLPGANGTQPGEPTRQVLRDYLEAMDVRPRYLAQVLTPAVDGVVWWNADKMAPWLVSNNGRLRLMADYRATPGAPELVMTQVVRNGQNQIALQCRPGQVTFTARYTVGRLRARRLARHAAYAYVEIDHKAWQPRHGERPEARGDAVTFTRQLPFTTLAPMLDTVSLGAWVRLERNPLRFGFLMAPVAVRQQARPFYAACQAVQPK